MLTLNDVKKSMGLTVTLQQVKNRMRTLEKRTGRRILITNNMTGKSKRYLVNPTELAAAMGDDISFDETENRIAAEQAAQDDRIDSLMRRVYRIEKRLGM